MTSTRLFVVRCMALLVVAFGGTYMAWRWSSTIAWDAWWIAIPLVLAETYSLGESVLYGVTMWNSRHRPEPPPAPVGATVDVFIATYNEPIDIVLASAIAARDMTYPHQTWILDDGNRPEFAVAAERIGVGYIVRGPDWDGRPRFAKAGNVNNALFQTSGEFIAVFDADQVPDATFLDRVLGYFDDPEVAFVQTPQSFWNVPPSDPLGSGADLFYGPIQQGKDGWGAAFFCGSNAVLRREALMALGLTMFSRSAAERVRKALHDGRRRVQSALEAGRSSENGQIVGRRAITLLADAEARVRRGDVLSDVTYQLRRQIAAVAAVDMLPQSVTGLIADVLSAAEVARTDRALAIDPIVTSSITEDMATAMHLHALGWASVYHHEVLVRGLAPEDVRTMLSQRQRWATGTMQVFFADNPLLLRGLTIGQRLMYLATMTSYLSGFAAVVYIAAPIVFLVSGVFPIRCDSIAFFVYFMPFFVFSQALFVIAGNRSGGLWRGQQMSFALFPTWIKATIAGASAVFLNKTVTFAVTEKTKQASGIGLRHIRPQLLAIGALVLTGGFGALQAASGNRPLFASIITLVWVGIDIVLLSATVRAARYRGPGDSIANPIAARVSDEVAEVVNYATDRVSATSAAGGAVQTDPLVRTPDAPAQPGSLRLPTHWSAAARFDAVAALAMRSHVADRTREGSSVVFVDVSGVRTITPSAVAVVVDLLRLQRASGGDLRIFGDSRTFTLAYETLALSRVTRLHGDSEDAVNARPTGRHHRAPARRGRGAHRHPMVPSPR